MSSHSCRYACQRQEPLRRREESLCQRCAKLKRLRDAEERKAQGKEPSGAIGFVGADGVLFLRIPDWGDERIEPIMGRECEPSRTGIRRMEVRVVVDVCHRHEAVELELRGCLVHT